MPNLFLLFTLLILRKPGDPRNIKTYLGVRVEKSLEPLIKALTLNVKYLHLLIAIAFQYWSFNFFFIAI